MQITKINSYNTNSYCQNNSQKRNSDVQFGHTPAYKLLTNAQKKAHEDFIIDMINYMPTISVERISQYLSNKNKEQIDLLHGAARKMHFECYAKKTRLPEDAQESIESLAFGVKNPDQLHFKILANQGFSFEDSKNLILLSEESKQNYGLIRKLLKVEELDGSITNLPAKQIQEIVTSPYAKKLAEHYDDFHPYITLTRENKDFSEKLFLELEAETPSFEPDELKKIIAIQRLQERSSHIQSIPEHVVHKHYSPEAMELMTKHIIPRSNSKNSKSELSQTDIKFAIYLLKTTTKSNNQVRSNYLEKAFWCEESPEGATSFFNKLDSDENFKVIYSRLYQDEHPIIEGSNGLHALMYYVDSIGSDVALEKYDNFANILAGNKHKVTSRHEEVVEELSKNINNRFYISNADLNIKRLRERDMQFEPQTFPKLRSGLARAKRKFTYEFLPKIFGKGESTPVKMNMSFAEYKTQKLLEAREILEQA